MPANVCSYPCQILTEFKNTFTGFVFFFLPCCEGFQPYGETLHDWPNAQPKYSKSLRGFCNPQKRSPMQWSKVNDFLFLAARLVAYWPAPIHAVEPPAYTVLTWLPARLAVCYSQRRSIFRSATAFTTTTLRWQQLRYRTINGKKLKPAILWAYFSTQAVYTTKSRQ